MKAYESTARCILNLNTRWRCAVSSMPQPLYLWEKIPANLCVGGWADPTGSLNSLEKNKSISPAIWTHNSESNINILTCPMLHVQLNGWINKPNQPTNDFLLIHVTFYNYKNWLRALDLTAVCVKLQVINWWSTPLSHLTSCTTTESNLSFTTSLKLFSINLNYKDFWHSKAQISHPFPAA